MVGYRTMSTLTIVALVLLLVALALAVAGTAALRRRKLVGTLSALLSGLLCLALAATAAAVAVGVKGYRALTREDVAALVRVVPMGTQRFHAVLRYPDGRIGQFIISGDALYVDAHILKWRPLFNLLGLHTGYELDRIGGRYDAVEDERHLPHTVYDLSPDRLVDLFAFVRRHPTVLAPLVDAQYGSGTFVGVDRPGRFQVLVSTTGLLVRPLPDSSVALP
jgi:hypothetical protein